MATELKRAVSSPFSARNEQTEFFATKGEAEAATEFHALTVHGVESSVADCRVAYAFGEGKWIVRSRQYRMIVGFRQPSTPR